MKLLVILLILTSNIAWSEWIEPPARSAKGYLVPTPDYQPVFPRDHGSHPEHGIEWWYWVGHLNAVNSEKKFGFQSTIFRLAGDPKESGVTQAEPFGNQNLFLVHTALSDLEEEKYIHHERVMREGWQASSSKKTLSLKVGGVKVNLLDKQEGHRVVTRYPDGAKLELTFKTAKPLVSFGIVD